MSRIQIPFRASAPRQMGMSAKSLLMFLGLTLLAGLSHAALVEAPAYPGLIRDTDQGITWRKDTNYAWNSGYQTSFMTWYQAVAWAGQLSFASGGQTFDNWRLPSATGDNLTRGAVQVPETGTWTLMLVALGLVGLRMYRRGSGAMPIA